MLRSYVPILDWLPRYRREWLRGDLMAGLTVGVMLIPQGMAYGMLAGVPPVYGLYASIVPLLIYAIFGTSRQLSVGPVALVSLLVMAGISQLGAAVGSEVFVALAITTALLAGIVQVGVGVFRLGFLINFLSHPVIAGFTSAAALIIGFSQISSLLGLPSNNAILLTTVLRNTLAHISEVHWPTLLIGLSGTALILWIRSINKLLPSGLIAVSISTPIVWAFGLHEQGVAIVGEVPRGLPNFAWPQLNGQTFDQLFPLALTIFLISFIESLAISKTLEARHKDYRISPNQELIALGLAKVVGAFFQAFPTTGSFTRSAVNDDAGAKSGLSSIFSAVFICLILLFFTPLFFYLPKAILASIVVAAVVSLVDYKEVIHLWHTDRRDWLAMMVTLVATLTLGIQNGVLSGVVLSMALMIFRNSRPHVAVLGQLPGSQHYRNIDRFEEAIRDDEILIVRFDAQLYFGNATYFRETMEGLVEGQSSSLRLLVLDASGIHDIDSSGIQALEETIDFLDNRQIDLYLAGVIGPVRDILHKNKLLENTGDHRYFLDVHSAVEAFKGKTSAPLQATAALQTNV